VKNIILPCGRPFVSFSTNDGHLFCLAANNKLQENMFCLNSLDMGYSITRTKYGDVYDTYLKVKQDNVINHNEIEKEILGNTKKFGEFIFNKLSEQQYLILDLDVSKIINYNTDKQVTLHSPIVTGINLENQTILLGDFFDFKHYDVQWVSLNEAYEAYEIIENYLKVFPREGDDEWIRTTSLIQYNELKLQIRLDGVISDIQTYLSSEKISFHTEQISAFHLVSSRIKGENDIHEVTELLEVGSGVSYYNFLKTYTRKEFKKRDYKTVQSASLLVTHFKILKKSVNFMIKEFFLENSEEEPIDEMIKYAKQLEAYFLKNYIHGSDNDKIEKCLLLIDVIQKLELDFLSKLITKIELVEGGTNS